MPSTLYDYPQYYDLLFSSGTKAESDFLAGCFARHAKRRVRRVFEPACGSGRLLVRLGERGFEVAGSDLNRRAVEYCNDRLERRGLPRSAVIGDISKFKLRAKVDAAFNVVNSFRHLRSERAAESHLRSVASSLASGGIYVLGLHLLPTRGTRMEAEKWQARRGRLSVSTRIWTKELRPRQREEVCGMTSIISSPRGKRRIVEELVFRTYTARQLATLLVRVPELELVAAYDFNYDLSTPASMTRETEDIVLVLRRSPKRRRRRVVVGYGG